MTNTIKPMWNGLRPLAFLFLASCGANSQQRQNVVSEEFPPLPIAVSNNAVAVTDDGQIETIYSMMGIGENGDWNSITNRAFALEVGATQWRELPSVPGPGRIAATAQAVRGKIVLFGGYTVSSDGGEKSVPNVDVFDPHLGYWDAGAPIPLPVDDAVSGVWRDSLVFIVSGWHDSDNVRNVQIYDAVLDSWFSGTPIPGVGVFGHAGAISGNTFLFIDGVRRNSSTPRYTMKPQAWAGMVNPQDPAQIAWSPIEPHPGPPLYRAAAGVCGSTIMFAGGTVNPYNYDGRGYDGNISTPRNPVFGFDTETRGWKQLGEMPEATMDHRALAVLGGRIAIVGGMRTGPRVAADVITRQHQECSTSTAN